jgi:hypothetical protein
MNKNNLLAYFSRFHEILILFFHDLQLYNELVRFVVLSENLNFFLKMSIEEIFKPREVDFVVNQ